MFRLVGFLVVVLVSVAGGWYLRGRYEAWQGPSVAATAAWKQVAPPGAARASQKLADLASGTRESVLVAPADFVAHVLQSASRGLPPSTTNPRAAAEGDLLILSATVNPREINMGRVLGHLASLLNETEEMRLSGRLHVVRPGLAEFRIVDARLGNLPVPSPLVPPLIKLYSDDSRPEGVSGNAIPVAIPEQVRELRISDGNILVFRRSG